MIEAIILFVIGLASGIFGFALFIDGLGEAINFGGDRLWRFTDLIVGGIMMFFGSFFLYIPIGLFPKLF